MKQSNYAILSGFVESEPTAQITTPFVYKATEPEPPAVDPILKAFLVVGSIVLIGFVIAKAK